MNESLLLKVISTWNQSTHIIQLLMAQEKTNSRGPNFFLITYHLYLWPLQKEQDQHWFHKQVKSG